MNISRAWFRLRYHHPVGIEGSCADRESVADPECGRAAKASKKLFEIEHYFGMYEAMRRGGVRGIEVGSGDLRQTTVMRELNSIQCASKPVENAGNTKDWPIAETTCPVVSNDWVNVEYKHLILEAPHGAANALPGQFFHLLCPTIGNDVPFLRRPMSIYRIDRGRGRLEFLYKIVGRGTRTLAELAPGDGFNILGPLGKGFGFDRSHRHVIQLARGVGLATLAPVAETAVAMGNRTTAILSARSPDLLMSVDYLRSVGADVITVTDSENTSGVDRVEGLVRKLIEQQGGDFLVTCGSNRLLALTRRLGAEYGVPGEVALEQTMGCGIGMCFACVREFRGEDGGSTYRRVCWDGPVFDIQEVLSW